MITKGWKYANSNHSSSFSMDCFGRYEQIFFYGVFHPSQYKKRILSLSLSISSWFCWLGYFLILLPNRMLISEPCWLLFTINIHYCNWITGLIFSLFTNASGSKPLSKKILSLISTNWFYDIFQCLEFY